MHRRLATIALVGAALFGLTACTGGGSTDASSRSQVDAGADRGPDTQSVAEACAAVQGTIEDAAAQFDNVAVDDPAAAVEAFRSAAAAIGDAAGTVGNAEVAAVLPDVEQAFSAVADAMKAVSQGDLGKMAELENISTDIQESLTAFQELCAP
jgi:hypothetical protein